MAQKLSLPNVTLVLIDTIAQELSNLAVNNTLNLISPGRTLIFTSHPEKFRERESVVKIETFTSTTDYNQFLWWKVPKYIKTSHILTIQWDGWVTNPKAWKPEFLYFDYIGALWPWHKNYRVGNGGFSLRSTELMLWLSKKHYQPGTHEDDILCRTYRRELQEYHPSQRPLFEWAPEVLAKQFSHEHPIEKTPISSFGFHDCRNWPRALSPSSLSIRLEICDQNPYISQKKEYKELQQALRLNPNTGAAGSKEVPMRGKTNDKAP